MNALKKKHEFDPVFDAQRLFRLILTAASNPAKPVDISEITVRITGPHPAFLAIALTLLDNEVGFCVIGDSNLSDEIVSLTLAKPVDVKDADFIFVPDMTKLGATIDNAKYGTLRDPHQSATIVVRIDGSEDLELKLQGAGIKDTAILMTSPAVGSALGYRNNQHYEYPTGVDFYFVTNSGTVFTLPRLVREAS